MEISKPCLILMRNSTVIHCKSDADLYETIQSTKDYTEGMINPDDNKRLAIFSDGSVYHLGDTYVCADSSVYNDRSTGYFISDPFDCETAEEARALYIITNKKYLIYHCTGPDAFTEVEVQPRRYAGFVEADCLQSAFTLSQNRENAWNPHNPCRSTSVGDIIQDDDKFFMVDNCGFRFLQEYTID